MPRNVRLARHWIAALGLLLASLACAASDAASPTPITGPESRRTLLTPVPATPTTVPRPTVAPIPTVAVAATSTAAPTATRSRAAPTAVPPTPAPAASCVDPGGAAALVGRNGCVEGRVTKLVYARGSRGSPTFLDFGDAFTAVVWVEDRPRFQGIDAWRNRRLRVRGSVESYRGTPQIVLRRADQVDLLEP